MALLFRRQWTRMLLPTRSGSTAGSAGEHDDHVPGVDNDAAYAATRSRAHKGTPAGAVSNDERSAVLVRAIRSSMVGDSTVISEIYADDVHGWSPALRCTSAAELAVEVEDRDDVAFSDIELEVDPLDVGEDRACVEWTARVTHSGPLMIDGEVLVESTGARVTLHGVTVAEFSGDRIRSFRQYWDAGEVLDQLAELPDD